jgi:hypothetical protein
MMDKNDEGVVKVTFSEFVVPGCLEERRRRRSLRGEKRTAVRLEIPAGWEVDNIHPEALGQKGPWLDEHRRLTNSEVITFAKGTGCTIDITAFPVK